MRVAVPALTRAHDGRAGRAVIRLAFCRQKEGRVTIYADEGCAIDADTIDADTIDADTDVETHTAPPVGARSVVTPPVYTSEERVGLFALIAALFYIASAAAGSTLLGVAAGAALAASVGSAMRSLAEDDTSHRATA